MQSADLVRFQKIDSISKPVNCFIALNFKPVFCNVIASAWCLGLSDLGHTICKNAIGTSHMSICEYNSSWESRRTKYPHFIVWSLGKAACHSWTLELIPFCECYAVIFNDCVYFISHLVWKYHQISYAIKNSSRFATTSLLISRYSFTLNRLLSKAQITRYMLTPLTVFDSCLQGIFWLFKPVASYGDILSMLLETCQYFLAYA